MIMKPKHTDIDLLPGQTITLRLPEEREITVSLSDKAILIIKQGETFLHNDEIDEAFMSMLINDIIDEAMPETPSVEFKGEGTVIHASMVKTCDICKQRVGIVFFDGKTIRGPWANMCLSCFNEVGVGLGTGVGQKYELRNGKWIKVAE